MDPNGERRYPAYIHQQAESIEQVRQLVHSHDTRGERLRQCEQQLGDVTQVVDEIMERALGAE